MVDSIPAELLELQTRFETWRANRKYLRESLPDELRSAAQEMLRRYPPSLIHRVLSDASIINSLVADFLRGGRL
jgi:hypothetical protein